MLFPFWRGLRRQKPGAGAAPKVPYQPQIHPLEDRLLPSPCLGNGTAFEKQCVAFPDPASEVLSAGAGNSVDVAKASSPALDRATSAVILNDASDPVRVCAEIGLVDIFCSVNNTPAKAGTVLEVNVAENAPKTVIDLAPLFASVNGLAADQGLRLFIIGSTNPELVTAALSDSDLILTFAAGQHGSATVTVRGRDVIGAYADVSFLVTVQAADPGELCGVLPLSEFVANKVGSTSASRAA